ncbi:MAG TPA: methionine--tRNA ligase subunit beta [Phycisphaerales bacterium]|nr:methionine--tRNA ligase subunit beta [Phycisphaerales bacterium]
MRLTPPRSTSGSASGPPVPTGWSRTRAGDRVARNQIHEERPMPEETATIPLKPEITFEDFAKLDLRVATVVEAEPHPNADRLLRLQLDDGSGTPRQICAGVKAYYAPQDLIGKQVIIAANLAPRTIRGEESRGMMLAASSAPKEDGGERDVVALTLMSPLEPGSIVS